MSMFLAQEVLASAKAANNSTVYSDSAKFRSTTGFSCVRVVVASAGSPTVTITQQCSTNNIDWFDPVDTADTALNAVTVFTTTTGSKYVQFSPVMAPYIRFKIVESASVACTVTTELVYQEASV